MLECARAVLRITGSSSGIVHHTLFQNMIQHIVNPIYPRRAASSAGSLRSVLKRVSNRAWNILHPLRKRHRLESGLWEDGDEYPGKAGGLMV